MTIKYIVNKDRTIMYPWDEELLAWLQENYPFSCYRKEELEHV